MKNLFLSSFIFTPILLQAVGSLNLRTFSVFVLYSWILGLILSITKKWSFLIAIPMLIFSALITSYIILTRSTVSMAVIGSIAESDFKESTELIFSPFFIKYMLLFILIIFIPFFFYYLFKKFKKTTLNIRYILIQLILLPVLLLFVANFKVPKTVIINTGLNRYFPIKQAIMIKRVILDNSYYINQYKNQNFTSKVTEIPENNTSIVLVIGEASRKISYGIYGNKYHTTPFMTQLETNTPDHIIAFSDVVATAPFTRVSVPSLLSLSNAESYLTSIGNTPSIYKILKETTINTTFVSSKLTKGFHDALASVVFKDNKKIIDAGGKYDEDLLKNISKTLKLDNKQITTIHLMGSHFKYKDRYPPEKTCYSPNIPEANYLSSIRYTDYVISKIMKIIMEDEKPYILIYVPDHGEYVNDNGDKIYGHGFKDLTYNEISIPLIFIFNNKFVAKYKKTISILKNNKTKKLSLDNISHTILGLMGIQVPDYYDNTYDLSSLRLKEHKRMIIDRNLNIDNINNINFIETNYPKIDIKNICD